MKKKSREFKGLLQGPRGQAMVEYILILVVSVSLVMAVAMQIFKPLQFFLQDFMGTYTQCLLETGELPSLGGSTNLKDDSCNPSWSKARQSAGSGTGSGGAGGLGSEGNSTRKGGRGGQNDDGGSPGSGTYAGSQSRRSPFFNPNRQGRGGPDGSGKGDKTVIVAVGDDGGSQFFRPRGGSSGGSYSRTGATVLSASMLSASEREKIGKAESKAPRTVASGENFSGPKKKIIIKPPAAKDFIMPDEQPVSFGNYLRILFIVAIVLVLVLLLGGQALQLSKSWEK